MVLYVAFAFSLCVTHLSFFVTSDGMCFVTMAFPRHFYILSFLKLFDQCSPKFMLDLISNGYRESIQLVMLHRVR